MCTKIILSRLIVVLMCYQLGQSAPIPASPCRNMFKYKTHSRTNETIGFITLTDVDANENLRLDVQISVGALLKKNQKAYLKLSKSLEATYYDIVLNKTAKYWIKFPVQDPIPVLVSIVRNGEELCSGSQIERYPETTINLSYTIIAPKYIVEQYAMKYSSITPRTTRRPTTTTTLTPKHLQDNCGTSNLVTELAMNGISTRAGQFPWVVPLFKRKPRADPEYFCVATIVTSRHLLTAAHCVYDKRPEEILAMPGKHDISDLSAGNGAIHADIQKISCHEEYESASDHLVDQDADIAVLRLENNLRFTQFIRPICLWRDQSPLNINSAHKGVVSGWGENEEDSSTTTPFYYTSTIVSKQQCSENLDISIPKRARVFCGDGAGSVACRGDSGSAMVMSRNNRFYLRGVVSKAVLDEVTFKCDSSKYAIYTDVPSFIYWIMSNTYDIDDD